MVLPFLRPFKDLLLPMEFNPDTFLQPTESRLLLYAQLTSLVHSTVSTLAPCWSLALPSMFSCQHPVLVVPPS